MHVWGDRSHELSGRSGGLHGGELGRVVVVILAGAVPAQQPPSYQQQGRRPPADVERRADLILLDVRQQRAVEVADDGVGGPGDRDETEDPGDDEQDPRNDAGLGFGPLVFHAVGTFPANDGHGNAEDPYDDGDDEHGPGRLQVPRQRQHGVVHLALHLPRALDHAVHPQALPDGLSRDDVGADEGRHLPGG